MNNREKMMVFAKADFKTAKEMIRCGFELETQSKHGECTCAEEIDVDAWCVARNEWEDDTWRELPDWLTDAPGKYNLVTLDRIRELISEMAEEHVDPIYYEECQGGCSAVDIEGIEVGDDGSVRGHEFRTVGALSFSDFVTASKSLFSTLGDDLEVDHGCSFHIHLSIPGIAHSYGETFQSSIMEYLMDNFKRLPKSVQDRVNSKKRSEFFSFNTTDDKYRAVAHRGTTWEFRLFGNVSNHRDALKCLALAIRAFQFAYRVKFGMTETAGVTFLERDDSMLIRKDSTVVDAFEIARIKKESLYGAEGF